MFIGLSLNSIHYDLKIANKIKVLYTEHIILLKMCQGKQTAHAIPSFGAYEAANQGLWTCAARGGRGSGYFVWQVSPA